MPDSAEDILKARDAGELDTGTEPQREERAAPERPERPERPKRDLLADEGGKRLHLQQPDDSDEGDGGDGETDGDGKQVPLKALHAEREKTKRYTEEVVDLRKQLTTLTETVLRQSQPQTPQAPKEPEQIDFDWDNPALTIDQRVELKLASERKQFGAALQQQKEAMQSSFAMQRHTPEVVKEAYVALAEAKANDPNFPTIYNEIMGNFDQYEALVQWHKKRKAVAEVGNDIEAFKAKIRAEHLEELRNGTASGAEDVDLSPPRRIKMPSDLSAARSVASRTSNGTFYEPSIKEILANR